MVSILVIDDNAQVRSVIRQVLETDDFVVREAMDGDFGLLEFRRAPTDLVICDLLMPGREGLETIGELRRIAPQVRILAITGGGRCAPEQLFASAYALGADAALAKPFSPAQMLDAVRRIVAGLDSATQR